MKLRRIPRVHRALVLALSMIGAGGCASTGDTWWGKDKFNHFGVSAGLSAVATHASLQAGRGGATAQSAGVLLVLIVGLGKEAHDEAQPDNSWSWKDMTWNLIGAVFGSTLVRSLHGD